MKLFALLMLAMTVNAFASEYQPKKMNCADLQDAVENYKVIKVRYGLLNISRYNVYADNGSNACSSEEVAQAAVFKTKDKLFCKAGYSCKRLAPRNF